MANVFAVHGQPMWDDLDWGFLTDKKTIEQKLSSMEVRYRKMPRIQKFEEMTLWNHSGKLTFL